LSASHITQLVENALIYNRLFAWKASFAVVPSELAACYVSNEFPQFVTDPTRLLPEYLYLFCTLDSTIRAVNAASTGSSAVSRNRFKEEEFLNFEIPLPPVQEQRVIVARWQKEQGEISAANSRVVKLEAEVPLILYHLLGTPPPETGKPVEKFLALWWKDLERWSFNFLSRSAQGLTGFVTSKYPARATGQCNT